MSSLKGAVQSARSNGPKHESLPKLGFGRRDSEQKNIDDADMSSSSSSSSDSDESVAGQESIREDRDETTTQSRTGRSSQDTELAYRNQLETLSEPKSPTAETTHRSGSGSQVLQLLATDSTAPSSEQVTSETSFGPGGTSRDKKKAPSFLSRFLNTNKKRSQFISAGASDRRTFDNDLPSLTERPEVDMASPIFAQDIDNIEFSPRIPQPASYVKVRVKNKKEKEFEKLFLAQELSLKDEGQSRKGTSGKPGKVERQDATDANAVWALAFSLDGKYLAAAGQNHVVKVWSVLSSLEEREEQEVEEDEMNHEDSAVSMRASIFRSTPIRVYKDHTGPVWDLHWSKNKFLLTTSQDRTVRLFHPSQEECLCTFKHSQPVHSIAFHPTDDRFFLAGSKDSKLRLWNIVDKRVEFFATVSDIITSVAFTPDGKTCMAGTTSGTISLYETHGLTYISDFNTKSKKRSKIAGLEAEINPNSPEQVNLMITSTDSRLRLFNFNDKSLILKLKGHKNDEISMHASTSEDGRYVICPSEDKMVYIWSLKDTENLPSISDKDKDRGNVPRPAEFFESQTVGKTSCAIFAPREMKMLLSHSGDPIYDICNPPPVKLVESTREGSVASSTKWNGSASSVNQKPTSKSKPVGPTSSPTIGDSRKYDSQLHVNGHDTPRTATSSHFLFQHQQQDTQANWTEKAAHSHSPIIVTASTSGLIRIYRGDCAYKHRKRIEFNPNDPIGIAPGRRYLRKALASSRSSFSGPGRSPNLPSSSTFNQNKRTPSIHSAVSARDRIGGDLVVRGRRSDSIASGTQLLQHTQPTARDRIERWRADVDGRQASTVSADNASSTVSSLRRANSVRSASAKSVLDGTSPSRNLGPTSTPRKQEDSPSRPPETRRLSSITNPLRLQGGQQSLMFWNLGQYEHQDASTRRHRSSASNHSPGSSPLRVRLKGSVSASTESEDKRLDSATSGDLLFSDPKNRSSVVSQLTSDEDDNQVDEREDEEEKERCPRCGGTHVQLKESRGWGFGRATRSLVCEDCGLERRLTT